MNPRTVAQELVANLLVIGARTPEAIADQVRVAETRIADLMLASFWFGVGFSALCLTLGYYARGL